MRKFIAPILLGFVTGIINSLVGFTPANWEYWVITIPFILCAFFYRDIENDINRKEK